VNGACMASVPPTPESSILVSPTNLGDQRKRNG